VSEWLVPNDFFDSMMFISAPSNARSCWSCWVQLRDRRKNPIVNPTSDFGQPFHVTYNNETKSLLDVSSAHPDGTSFPGGL